MASLNINGKTIELDVDPSTPLLWALREQAGLTGAKYGCGISQCGACTVLVNGRLAYSCIVLTDACDGGEVTTVEGLAAVGDLAPIQRAFAAHDAAQCGYCTPGMVMASISLLKENPNPTEEEVRIGLEGNLCRCTGYHNIVKSVLAAAQAK